MALYRLLLQVNNLVMPVQWLASHVTDPKTNVQLGSKVLIPNHGLRATIEEFLVNNETH